MRLRDVNVTADLFDDVADLGPPGEAMAEGAMLLRGFAGRSKRSVAALRDIVAAAPFRHMVTPGGHRMSVAMTNCGGKGWVTDRSGYRYDGTIRKAAGPGRRCRRVPRLAQRRPHGPASTALRRRPA